MEGRARPRGGAKRPPVRAVGRCPTVPPGDAGLFGAAARLPGPTFGRTGSCLSLSGPPAARAAPACPPAGAFAPAQAGAALGKALIAAPFW